MSLHGTTVLVTRPGHAALRLEISGAWPYQLAALLLVPVLIGFGARLGVGRARELPRAHPAVRALPATAIVSQALPPANAAASAAVDAAQRVLPRMIAAMAPARPVTSARLQTVARDAAKVVSAKPILRAFRTRAAAYAPSLQDDTLGYGATLHLQAARTGESVRVQAFDERGAPRPEAFAALRHLMRCRVTGEEIAIDPRLVRILSGLAALYDRPLQLISGHRVAGVNGTSPTSQHTTGRAADIRIPGVTIEELRRRAIELGAGGVGLYPEKGFVHVDVRSRPKYHWIYTAASGEQPYERYAGASPSIGVPVPGATPDAHGGAHAAGE